MHCAQCGYCNAITSPHLCFTLAFPIVGRMPTPITCEYRQTIGYNMRFKHSFALAAMNTPASTSKSSTNTTPHISFIAYPIGAWLVAIIGAGLYTLNSQNAERLNIMQILIAASMATATVGGTLYVLSLLALKRYPSFKTSFMWGFLVALVCIATAIILKQMMLSFVMGGAFLLISAIVPFFMKKRTDI